MITVNLLGSALGQNPAQYAARARAQARIARQRSTQRFNPRSYRPDPARVRAQRAPRRSSLPDIRTIEQIQADNLRRQESKTRWSAMLTQMVAPTWRPGAGQRAVGKAGASPYARQVQANVAARQELINRTRMVAQRRRAQTMAQRRLTQVAEAKALAIQQKSQRTARAIAHSQTAARERVGLPVIALPVQASRMPEIMPVLAPEPSTELMMRLEEMNRRLGIQS